MKANDAKSRCLTNEQIHMVIDACERGQKQNGRVAIASLIGNDPCARIYAEQCAEATQKWADNNPQDAACLSQGDLTALIDGCVQWKRGELSPDDAQARLQAMIAAGCPVIPPGPPLEPPPPVEAPLPPPMPPAEVIYDEAPMYTPPQEPLHAEEPSAYRKWGPVVGALLIVGGGIYLLR
jgi:hypothetical protein